MTTHVWGSDYPQLRFQSLVVAIRKHQFFLKPTRIKVTQFHTSFNFISWRPGPGKEQVWSLNFIRNCTLEATACGVFPMSFNFHTNFWLKGSIPRGQLRFCRGIFRGFGCSETRSGPRTAVGECHFIHQQGAVGPISGLKKKKKLGHILQSKA